jgi:hypothetical protein
MISAMGPNRIEEVVEALRDVLGWMPKGTDVEGFVAALARAIRTQELDEGTEWMWAPGEHSAHPELSAGLTGAQASLHQRARAAVEAAIPLLDGLAPLRPTVDPGELEALRSVVRQETAELVTELGMAGGPRVLRLDVLFDLLLGPDSTGDPAEVGGLLGTLRDRFGLTPQAVTGVEEEQTVTNFLLVVDYIRGIRQRWKAARPFFDRRDEAYIGDHLVRLRRALAVVAESVAELQSVLDVLGIGPAKRDVTIVDLPDEAPLTLSEFLNWIQRFAAEEGPALVRNRRKAGAEALASTTALLRAVVRAAGPGLRTLLGAIADEIDQLERELERLYEEAMIVTDESSPSIDDVYPVQGAVGHQVKVVITGSGFAAGADVRLIRSGFSDIWSSEVTVVNAGNVTISLDLSGAAPGPWDVEVMNPQGPSAVLPGGFLVLSDDW